jgi:4-hydroxy-2-oxoheptanedioate aldolase
MRRNTLKEKLAAGKAVFGVQVNYPTPAIVETLGYLGFDWVLIDNEHGSITVDNAEPSIVACELSGIAPIVRPVGNRPEIIAPFMDRGAWGVQVPHVNTAAEARAVVDAVKYPPMGHRGIYSRGRAAEYGTSGSVREYAEAANRETLVCLMIEEPEAVENLEEMVKVEGVDVFFIGSGDLSMAMGYPGEQTRPEVQRMMERGVEVIRAGGKVAGVSCPDNLVPKYLGLGVQYYHSTVDTLLQASGRSYLESMRKTASRAGM